MRMRADVLCSCGCGQTVDEVLVGEAWREKRARVNDEQALEDMTRGTPRDVPRATHLPIRHREPHSGETLLLVGLLIGSLIVIGVLLAGMPAHLPPTGCTP
jgi:hypothetical protein